MRMDKLTRLRHPALDRGPDPRVVRSRQAALSAVRELLAEEGWTGVTHVAVAARSGVGRTTLYRHWPDVASLIHDAIVERIGQARTAWTGDLRADLISELNGLRRLLHDPASERTMRGLLERAPFDPAFASLKETLYRSGSAGFRAILEAATTRGELQPTPISPWSSINWRDPSCTGDYSPDSTSRRSTQKQSATACYGSTRTRSTAHPVEDTVEKKAEDPLAT
jgi:AcrR family transcriptional regulator